MTQCTLIVRALPYLSLLSAYTQWHHKGADPPGDTIQVWHPNEILKNVAAFRKNTEQNDARRWELWSCDEMTAKKGHHFAEGDE